VQSSEANLPFKSDQDLGNRRLSLGSTPRYHCMVSVVTFIATVDIVVRTIRFREICNWISLESSCKFFLFRDELTRSKKAAVVGFSDAEVCFCLLQQQSSTRQGRAVHKKTPANLFASTLWSNSYCILLTYPT